MARAYHNLAGFIRDVRAAQSAAAQGSQEAGKLLDSLCDVLDDFDAFGGEADGGGDLRHDEGSDDPEGVDADEMESGDAGSVAVSPAGESTRRVYSARGGARTAVLTGQLAAKQVLARKGGA